MNNNQRYNQIAIKQFRKELEAMFEDIRDIDIKVLNKAVNIGVKDVKANTPVGQYSGGRVGGYMRKNWKSSPTVKGRDGVTKTIFNIMDYSSYVNYGHRVVDGSGATVGFIKGHFMLEKAISKVDKVLLKEFEKEVEKVRKKHDK